MISTSYEKQNLERLDVLYFMRNMKVSDCSPDLVASVLEKYRKTPSITPAEIPLDWFQADMKHPETTIL